MQDEYPVCVPLASCFKLSRMMILNTDEVVGYMAQLPEMRAAENLMAAMVYTQLDNAWVFSMKGRFRANPW